MGLVTYVQVSLCVFGDETSHCSDEGQLPFGFEAIRRDEWLVDVRCHV
jgi:hypothetical protein